MVKEDWDLAVMALLAEPPASITVQPALPNRDE